MYQDIDRRIRRALGGLRLAFRAVLTRVDASAAVQFVQADALAGERLLDNELFQHYGFTSRPLPGTMAVVLPVGGKTSHGIVIATEHGDYRLRALESGEVAIYTDEGAHIVLKRGRLIEVECDEYRVNCTTYTVNAESAANFTTPMVTASAQVTAQGQLNGNGGMAIRGGHGAEFQGDVRQTGGSYTTDGDVVAGGTSLEHHHHEGTGEPVP